MILKGRFDRVLDTIVATSSSFSLRTARMALTMPVNDFTNQATTRHLLSAKLLSCSRFMDHKGQNGYNNLPLDEPLGLKMCFVFKNFDNGDCLKTI